MHPALSQTMQTQLDPIPAGSAWLRTYCAQTDSWMEQRQPIVLSNNDKLLTNQYPLLPGIHLSYHYFLADQFHVQHPHLPTVLEINHCRYGRIGWQMEKQQSLYLGDGDLSLHRKDTCAQSEINLPLGYYEGLSFSIELPTLLQHTPDILKEAQLDLELLRQRFWTNDSIIALPASKALEQLSSVLYDLPEKLILPYGKLKCQELLLFLSQLTVQDGPVLSPYDAKQIAQIKEIHAQLTAQIDIRYTIEELSRQYLMNTSTLKAAFKAVYGLPIATYMKQYRMNQAASMLLETELSIAAIANAVGYENQSKFTTAFKSTMGLLPTAYRREHCRVTKTVL